MKPKKKKSIIKKVTAFFVIAITLFLTVAVLASEKFEYILSDTVSHIGSHAELEKTSDLNFESYTLKGLEENPKVTFNNNLLLINGEHTLSAEINTQLADYKSLGILMDENLCEHYEKLSDAVYDKFGENLYISSSYRTSEKQAQIKAEEGDTAQNVGASEHQAGLALDVYIQYFAGSGFIKSDAGKFVNDNCYEYGFIIRYPYYGTKQTGIDYEPWHIRYVGKPHAEIITKNRITLEEYISQLKLGEFYKYDGYIISRQSAEGDIKLPQKYSSMEISPDNCGNYVVTVKI